MQRWLSVFATAGVLLALPACDLLYPRLRVANVLPFFEVFRTFNDPAPPQRGLDLWVEGDSLTPDAVGRVSTWPDMRPDRGRMLRAWTPRSGPALAGTIASATIRTPIGLSRMLRAVRCATGPRCSYAFSDAAGNPLVGFLMGHPYAIFAVVRRSGPRGDNYVVMTNGIGCMPAAGGTGCTPNTTLHLGWQEERRLRLGQYDNDVDLDVHPFNTDRPALSLVVGLSNSLGKTVALLEPLFDTSNHSADTRRLDGRSTVFVGGTPWVDDNPVPDWHFEGDIFAVLIYGSELNETEVRGAADYLRNRYGPR